MTDRFYANNQGDPLRVIRDGLLALYKKYRCLGIPAAEITGAAFRSRHPAKLGSRCTVFMNNTVITEQKNSCQPDGIMAGLSRSIIENVFTKIVRVSGPDVFGEKVVVQGGTFCNGAVLRALEQYLGR